jgi:palmitoyl-protein thioesterase
MESYLAYSSFLAEVNNERTTKNSEYARNLNNTEMLVMYLFTEDETLVPKESAVSVTP